jgi:hypothetical protein
MKQSLGEPMRTPRQSRPRTPRRLDPAVPHAIGEALRYGLDEVVHVALPERMVRLMKALERAESDLPPTRSCRSQGTL